MILRRKLTQKLAWNKIGQNIFENLMCLDTYMNVILHII